MDDHCSLWATTYCVLYYNSDKTQVSLECDTYDLTCSRERYLGIISSLLTSIEQHKHRIAAKRLRKTSRQCNVVLNTFDVWPNILAESRLTNDEKSACSRLVNLQSIIYLAVPYPTWEQELHHLPSHIPLPFLIVILSRHGNTVTMCVVWMTRIGWFVFDSTSWDEIRLQ